MTPPGQCQQIHAASTLVVAPHFDDEVLGCGGLVVQLTVRESVVRALFLTDGGGGVEEVADRDAYRKRRKEEAKAASTVLGLAGIDRLDLPDGGLDQHQDALVRGLRRALLSQRPALLLVPSPLEASRDHRAVFAALHRLLGGVRAGDALEPIVSSLVVLAYEVNHPFYPSLLVDVSEQIGTIEQAMGCYRSQQERHDYLRAGLGLRRFRALSVGPEIEGVEGYVRLTLDDFRTRSPAGLITAMGGAAELLAVEEGPRISVIVRTRDRPALLAAALESLARSSYRRAEVVLVNDGGTAPTLPDAFPLPVVPVELASNRGRAGAANAGVAAARGSHIAFLDDDDLVEPEHLATLAGLAGGAGVRVAYTDAAVGIYELDGEAGWKCSERRLPYSRDFHPELLLFDNYIPFNTLVIERALLDGPEPFDTSLPFFEDWDLLIRLAAQTPFHHLARVTCEYRHFRGGGHHILGDRPRERADFLTMKARVMAKHGERRSAEVTARVVDLLRAEVVAEQEAAAAARRVGEESEERYHAVHGRLTVQEADRERLAGELAAAREIEVERRLEIQALHREGALLRTEIGKRDGELQKLYDQESELGQHINAQADDLRQAYAEIERLNAVIQAMEASRAWRLHQWVQRHKP